MLKLVQPKPVPDSAKPGEQVTSAVLTSGQDPSPSLPGADLWLHTPASPKRFWSQNLVWLMTLAALGVHAIALLIPLPAEKKADAPPPPEEKQVRITQLSSGKPSTPKAPGQKVKPIARPATPPKLSNRPPSAPPIPSTKPAAAAPTPTQPEAQAAKQETPEAAGNEDIGGNPWEDFPQYPGAQPGCYNLPSCMQTGKPLGDVSSFFERELKAKKYTAQATINEANRRVYQVSRGNLTQFLSLIQVEGKGTLYVLSEAPRSLADLAQAVEVPPAVYNVLSNLAAADAGRESFAQPDAFFTADGPRPEVGIVQLVTDATYDTFFDTYFRNNLVNNGFTSSDTAQDYGGGLLYTVTKDDLTLYISLVPTVDRTGTLVVVLKSLPQ